MFCTNCGNAMEEGQDFCTKCGQKVEKEKTTNTKKGKKSYKTLIILFAIEALIVFLFPIIFTISYFVSSHHSVCDSECFEKAAYKYNYIVNGMDEYYDDDNANYLVALKDEYSVAYIETESVKDAEELFEKQKATINYGNSETNMDLVNYQLYHTVDDGVAHHLIRVDNTVLYTVYEVDSEDEAMVIPNEIDYGNKIDYSVIISVLIPVIIMTGIMIVAMWKIFVKAGMPGWYSLIPIFSTYKYTKIVYKKSTFFIIFIILSILVSTVPFMMIGASTNESVGIMLLSMPLFFILSIALTVFECFILYRFPKMFGKGMGFSICNILFTPITMQIIAFDDSKYIPDKKCDKIM